MKIRDLKIPINLKQLKKYQNQQFPLPKIHCDPIPDRIRIKRKLQKYRENQRPWIPNKTEIAKNVSKSEISFAQKSLDPESGSIPDQTQNRKSIEKMMFFVLLQFSKKDQTDRFFTHNQF